MSLMRTISLISILALTNRVDGFAVFNPFQQEQEAGNPQLESLGKATSGESINLKLNVGSNPQYRMSIQGLELELSSNNAEMNVLRPKLPGCEGPNARVSAGAKEIIIREEGYYIDMDGKQTVPLSHGCWELVWREGAGAGVIVCGFLLEHDVKRNDACLQRGRIYMSLPVWTTKGLRDQQEYRRMIEARAEKHAQEKLDAFQKMEKTDNVLMKALHFRNAAHADEQLSFVPMESVAQIPMDKGDTMPLGDELMITTKGTVWTKEESKALFGGENIYHTLLGTATVSSPAINKSLKP